MSRSLGRLRQGILVAFVAAVVLGSAATVSDAATRSIVNFDMYTNQVNTYGGGSYVTSDYGGQTHYRWLDTPPTSSRISNNHCSNYNNYGAADFGQHTEYRLVSQWFPGTCVVLRGRSLGTINFFNHDGNWLF